MAVPTKDELLEENAQLRERLGVIYDEIGDLLGVDGEVEEDEVDEDEIEDVDD